MFLSRVEGAMRRSLVKQDGKAPSFGKRSAPEVPWAQSVAQSATFLWEGTTGCRAGDDSEENLNEKICTPQESLDCVSSDAKAGWTTLARKRGKKSG